MCATRHQPPSHTNPSPTPTPTLVPHPPCPHPRQPCRPPRQVRELIYREILEYHPQMLADYLAGGHRQPNFVYPSAGAEGWDGARLWGLHRGAGSLQLGEGRGVKAASWVRRQLGAPAERLGGENAGLTCGAQLRLMLKGRLRSAGATAAARPACFPSGLGLRDS